MVGVDEVGRGCLAGPLLVVAARQNGPTPDGLKDSKLLSRAHRQRLYPKLINSFEFGEGWVSAVEIDRLGLSRALELGAKRALKNLGAAANEQIILDGKFNYLPKVYKNSRAQVRADNLVPAVSAASVYAKLSRDQFMIALAKKHRRYSFELHVGYGTQAHRDAINSYGPLQGVHRLSFAPLKGTA